MPNISDIIQQTFPAYAGTILPHVGTAKIQTDKGAVPYGPNGIFGPQNVGQAYVDFLNKLEIEKQMSPLAGYLEHLKTRLATDINQKYFKMDPKNAERTAHTVSAGSLAASAILLQNNASDILKILETAMVKSGVVSPTIAQRDYRRGISLQNRKVEKFMKHTLEMLLNPTYIRQMGAVSNTELAGVISTRFLNGDFNRIISTSGYFEPSGALSKAGKNVLSKNIISLSQLAETSKRIYGSTAQKSLEALNKTLGKDVTEDLGFETTNKLLKQIAANGTAVGYSQEDLQGILSHVSERFQREGRPAEDSLAAVKDFIAMQGAGRFLPETHEDSQGLMKFVQSMNQGPFAQLEAASFAALKPIYGAAGASKLITDAGNYASKAKGTDTYQNYQGSFLTYINKNLSPSSHVTLDTLGTYLNTTDAKRFLSSGQGSKEALKQLTNSVVESRKKLVETLFPTLDAQDRTVLRKANFSDRAIRQIQRQKYYATPMERMKADQKLQGALDALAQHHGFETGTQVDHLLQVVKDPTKLKALQSYSQGQLQIEQGLQRKGKGTLQESILSGPLTLKNILTGVSKDTGLKPEDIAAVHQVPGKKRQELNNILSTWYNPSSASAPVREAASKYLERM